jgi:hypothetical protein
MLPAAKPYKSGARFPTDACTGSYSSVSAAERGDLVGRGLHASWCLRACAEAPACHRDLGQTLRGDARWRDACLQGVFRLLR